jgi:hypothetical protein
MEVAVDQLLAFVGMSGAAIAILSIVTIALIFWQAMRLLTLGA